MAFGDDASEREALASQAAVAAAALAPPGASAPIQPPSAARSIVQAVVATALVIVGALAIRRLLAGRARRLAPVAPPAPILVDVSRDAATLRRDGRRLATLQIAASAVVVVGLVADVGWWWVLVVAVGVAIGLAATARARRRELARSPGRWSLPSARTSLLGLVGALLVLVGVACAVRGLKEWVLLPSLTHLRLADRVGVSPDRLAAAMAVAGIVALVLAAVVLRRARAHARSDRKRAVGAGRGDDILYLRSFEDDRLSVPSVHSARRPFFELFGVRGRDPFEEGIAWELAAQGQLTAIGRPGASTLSLGATRDLVDEDEWQSAVTARMAASRWVVLALGATTGLEWEVDALARHGHLAKTMFVVPPLAADAIEVAMAGDPPDSRPRVRSVVRRAGPRCRHAHDTRRCGIGCGLGGTRRSPRRGRLPRGDRARAVRAAAYGRREVRRSAPRSRRGRRALIRRLCVSATRRRPRFRASR